MEANIAYFERNGGEWNWTARFTVLSWKNLVISEAPITHKIRSIAMVLSQLFMGEYSMRTFVDFRREARDVHHGTELKNWGITFYRSQKIFSLEPDSVGLRLSGQESYWPLIFSRRPFVSGLHGAVAPSTTSARYQMPLFGVIFECETHLARGEGTIVQQTNWLRCHFKLTPDSLAQLNSRF